MDWHDYGARHFDGIVWRNVDPHTEKYYNVSPWGYCHGNPINKIDPDGMDDYYTKTGDFIGHVDKETDRIMIRQWQIDVEILDTRYSISLYRHIKFLDNISAESYSNIFTDILSKMEGVNVNELHNNKVSVRIWEQEGNIPTSVDEYNDASNYINRYADIGRDTNDGKQNLTVYIDRKSEAFKSMTSTIANVQNLLGAHEYMAHFINKLIHTNNRNDPVIQFQKNHPSWEKTTQDFKNEF